MPPIKSKLSHILFIQPGLSTVLQRAGDTPLTHTPPYPQLPARWGAIFLLIFKKCLPQQNTLHYSTF